MLAMSDCEEPYASGIFSNLELKKNTQKNRIYCSLPCDNHTPNTMPGMRVSVTLMKCSLNEP